MTAEVAAVKRGAKLLDQLVPNWFKRVNTRKLAMDDNSMCVLGQTHGAFTAGLEELVETAIQKALKKSPLAKLKTNDGLLAYRLKNVHVELDEFYYGFNHLYGRGSDASSGNESYERLSRQWVKEIQKRRQQ